MKPVGLAKKFLEVTKREGLRKALGKTYRKLMGSRMQVPSYKLWRMRYASVEETDLAEMASALAAFSYRPLISIVMPVYNTKEKYLRLALDSVLEQVYPNWELCVADDASTDQAVESVLAEYEKRDSRIHVVRRQENGHISAASNSAIEMVTGEFIALMDHDDLLPAEALFCVAQALEEKGGELDLIYTDEDKVDADGGFYDPYFKPDWNSRLIVSQNFVAHLGVYRTSLVREIGGFRVGFEGSQDYDFLLRFLRLTDKPRICHIPHILYHWRIFRGNHTFSTDNMEISDESAHKALSEHFRGSGVTVEDMSAFPGVWKVSMPMPERPPMVSIIIPDRDHVAVLRTCLESIFEQTSYPNYEIIIVDNGSEEQEALNYFEEVSRLENVTVLRDDRPFNYSALNNLAVNKAAGEYLLFLNNDIKVRGADWLTEMVRSLAWPGVGAVGAKLLYENGKVQHAGVTLGVYGVAAHSGRHLPQGDVGYFGHMCLEREVSAVTGACMLVRREAFEAAGGFDEKELAVSYNDVDLCLKIRQQGWQVIYNPSACLYHLESISRGADEKAEQKEQNRRERHKMYERYGSALEHDPYYNPNLSLADEDYQIAFMPRVGKPWRPWLEFVCPFHRGDVLLGLQVAYAAHLRGIKLRMHVSEGLMPWIADFHCPFPVLPVPIGVPKAADTYEWFNRVCHHVSVDPGSSGHIVGSHPQFDFAFLGLDIVENLLHTLGLPIGEKLHNFKPEARPLPEEVSSLLTHRTALLHASGGWMLKSLPASLVAKLTDFFHREGWRVVQIGGPGDKVLPGMDGSILCGEGTGFWRSVFEKAGLLAGVDSWSSHFAALLDVPQITFYGSTRARDVCSRSHFEGKAPALIMETVAECSPCNLYQCRENRDSCRGFSIEVEKMRKFLAALD